MIGTKLRLEGATFYVLLHSDNSDLKEAHGVLLDENGRSVAFSSHVSVTEESVRRPRANTSVDFGKILHELDKPSEAVSESRHLNRFAIELAYLTGVSLFDSTQVPPIVTRLTGSDAFPDALAAYVSGRQMVMYKTGEPISKVDFAPLLRESLRRGKLENVDALLGLPPQIKEMGITDVKVVGRRLFEMGEFRRAGLVFQEGYRLFPAEYGLYLAAGISSAKSGDELKALKHFLVGVLALESSPSSGRHEAIGKKLRFETGIRLLSNRRSDGLNQEIREMFTLLEYPAAVIKSLVVDARQASLLKSASTRTDLRRAA